MKHIKGTWFPDKEHHMCEWPEFKAYGTYQRGKYDMAKKYITGDTMALDIGAHIGFWTRYMAVDFQTVHAFEPVPSHYACLSANTGHMTNVKTHNLAIGDKSGYVKMDAMDGNTGGTKVGSTGSPEDTEIIRLDDISYLNPEFVDFVKIDVEGYEPLVIEGGRRFFRETEAVVCVEQKRDRYKEFSKHDPIKLLQDLGYMVVDNMTGDFVLVKPRI